MQRIKIASVAATVQGVNAENFIKFCEALEGWVAKGEDPLKLEVPSPVREIDWDMPQLVRSTWNSCVVETNGEHSGYGFSGTVVIAGNNGFGILGMKSDIWTKSSFVYHGEIPQKKQQ